MTLLVSEKETKNMGERKQLAEKSARRTIAFTMMILVGGHFKKAFPRVKSIRCCKYLAPRAAARTLDRQLPHTRRSPLDPRHQNDEQTPTASHGATTAPTAVVCDG